MMPNNHNKNRLRAQVVFVFVVGVASLSAIGWKFPSLGANLNLSKVVLGIGLALAAKGVQSESIPMTAHGKLFTGVSMLTATCRDALLALASQAGTKLQSQWANRISSNIAGASVNGCRITRKGAKSYAAVIDNQGTVRSLVFEAFAPMDVNITRLNWITTVPESLIDGSKEGTISIYQLKRAGILNINPNEQRSALTALGIGQRFSFRTVLFWIGLLGNTMITLITCGCLYFIYDGNSAAQGLVLCIVHGLASLLLSFKYDDSYTSKVRQQMVVDSSDKGVDLDDQSDADVEKVIISNGYHLIVWERKNNNPGSFQKIFKIFKSPCVFDCRQGGFEEESYVYILVIIYATLTTSLLASGENGFATALVASATISYFVEWFYLQDTVNVPAGVLEFESAKSVMDRLNKANLKLRIYYQATFSLNDDQCLQVNGQRVERHFNPSQPQHRLLDMNGYPVSVNVSVNGDVPIHE